MNQFVIHPSFERKTRLEIRQAGLCAFYVDPQSGFARQPLGGGREFESGMYSKLIRDEPICDSSLFGAENETRTRDPNLGKVVLYQLSYFRIAVICSTGLQRYHFF